LLTVYLAYFHFLISYSLSDSSIFSTILAYEFRLSIVDGISNWSGKLRIGSCATTVGSCKKATTDVNRRYW
jgi:hypothetical protein